jgi:hypothetical protein
MEISGMKIRISIPIVMLFCLLVGQVQAAETPPILDTFECTLANGKDAEDIASATAFWKKQVSKIDNEALNQYAAWLITPIRSSNPADFYWLGASPNMNMWAQGNAAYAGSSEGAAAEARFAELGKCTSNAWSSEQLYGGDAPGEGDNNDVLEAFGCTLHEGKTMSNVRTVEANFVKEAKAAGLEMNIFRLSPLYTDGQVDLVYFVGHDDMETYGATATKQAMTPATATANQYFNLVMDCGAGLYNVDTIKGLPAAE